MRSLLTAVLLTALMTPAVCGEMRDYEIDGATYEGYYAAPASGSKGLVLIIHDWDGLTDYEVKRAEILADMGYATFAIDLYGKGNRPTGTAEKKAETGKLYKNRQKMRSLILGGLVEARKLHAAESAVVMGYCFGGAAVLELARSGQAKNVKGYATFHGGLSTPAGQSYPSGTAPILIAHGGADAAISMQDVASLAEHLEKAGVTYTIDVYSGAPHAFTVFGSKRYQKRADKQSWAAFANFLKETLDEE